MPKICLVILIGVPAAGKTSFCKALTQKLAFRDDYKCYTITYDCIVNESLPGKYRRLRNCAYTSTESIIKSIGCTQDTPRRHLILIDDNMYYRSMRYEYYKLARKYQCAFLQVYVEIQLELALARNAAREKSKVPENTVRQIAAKLETPGKKQWEINLFVLNTAAEPNSSNLEEFVESIDTCLNKPASKFPEDKTETVPIAKLQQVDLILRKIVHKLVNRDKTLAATYTARKKLILQKIKAGELSVDPDEVDLYDYLETLLCLVNKNLDCYILTRLFK